MCGIAGIADFTDETNPKERQEKVQRMTGLIKNRGPDGHGYFHDDKIALGHTRLKIIDLEDGTQPMFNESGEIVLVYNGEIYNHHELREQLKAKGHIFKTRCDTEVVIHAYEEWGEGCLTRFNGMFAFALWEKSSSRLFLARDRLGIKPLFWCEMPGSQGIAFASTIQSLLAAKESVPALNSNALVKYLILQYVPSPETIFDGIHKLEPGCHIAFDKSGINKKRYWSLPEGELSEADSKPEKLLELLSDSVGIRLGSDVPVGAFLSGGIDSSSVVALITRASKSPIETFSVSFDGPGELDESPYFKAAARYFGTDENILKVTADDMTSRIGEAIAASGEPVADPALLPTYIMSEFAAKNVKVVLTGEGADELFGGYLRYKLDEFAHNLDIFPGALKKIGLRAASLFFPRDKARKAIHALNAPTLAARHIGWVRVFARDELARLVPDIDVKQVEEELEAQFSGYFAGARRGLNSTLRADISTWLPDDLLAKVDYMSMAHGLEARVPFLDHRIVEWAARLKPGLKIKGNSSKIILKKALKGTVPDNILKRKKAGFTLPLSSWFKGKLSGWVEEEIRNAGEPFDSDELAKLIDSCLKRGGHNELKLFSVLAFKLWRDAARAQ